VCVSSTRRLATKKKKPATKNVNRTSENISNIASTAIFIENNNTKTSIAAKRWNEIGMGK